MVRYGGRGQPTASESGRCLPETSSRGSEDAGNGRRAERSAAEWAPPYCTTWQQTISWLSNASLTCYRFPWLATPVWHWQMLQSYLTWQMVPFMWLFCHNNMPQAHLRGHVAWPPTEFYNHPAGTNPIISVSAVTYWRAFISRDDATASSVTHW